MNKNSSKYRVQRVKVLPLILLGIFLVIVGVTTFFLLTRKKTTDTRSQASSEDGVKLLTQLRSANWQYKKIFSVEDVPLPESMKGTINPKVLSLYSPSVTEFQNKKIMFFGVSLYCLAGNESWAARDSIAMAESTDGLNWKFVKYVLEPNTSVCFAAQSTWVNGAVFQVNDPEIFVNQANEQDKKFLRVMYTTATWEPNKNTHGCGHVGIAKFDANLNLVSREDKYLDGSAACNADSTGYSRPGLMWKNPLTTELWVDSNYITKKIKVDSLDKLQKPSVMEGGLQGGDVSFATLDYANPVIMYNGMDASGKSLGINAQVLNDVYWMWSGSVGITRPGNGTWDDWYHSSPSLYLEKKSCTPLLYFSGMSRSKDDRNLPIGTIAVAYPPSNKKFSFPLCKGK